MYMYVLCSAYNSISVWKMFDALHLHVQLDPELSSTTITTNMTCELVLFRNPFIHTAELLRGISSSSGGLESNRSVQVIVCLLTSTGAQKLPHLYDASSGGDRDG